jgi:hypothetical protein
MSPRTSLAAIVLALVSVSCSGPGSGTASPSTQGPVASSFESFATEQCAALQSLFRAYGNPDTAGLSPLMRSFADAIDRGDAAAAGEKAREIRSEIEGGRAHVRSAGAWGPAVGAMAQLDRLLVAFERLVEVRLDAMSKGPGVAEREGQAAFEAAGGAEAWFGWIRSVGEVRRATGASTLPKCEGVPIS